MDHIISFLGHIKDQNAHLYGSFQRNSSMNERIRQSVLLCQLRPLTLKDV